MSAPCGAVCSDIEAPGKEHEHTHVCNMEHDPFTPGMKHKCFCGARWEDA